MHLNHVNLCASDVDRLGRTLSTHFGHRVVDAGTAPGGDGAGDSRYTVLVGADRSELVITQIAAPAEGTSACPEGFHLGLVQDSREAVLALYDELRAAGLEPRDVHDGFEVWGATWTAFYCPVGDDLEIEANFRTPSALLDGEDG